MAFLVFVTVLLAFHADTRVALYVGAAWLVILAVAFRLLPRTPKIEMEKI